MSCGPGADLAAEPQRAHLLPRDCERVQVSFLGVSPLYTERPGVVAFLIEPATHRGASYDPCGVIRLGEPAGSLGRLVFKMPRRKPKRVRVPLAARGRRLIAAPGIRRVVVTFGTHASCPRGRVTGRTSQGQYAVGL